MSETPAEQTEHDLHLSRRSMRVRVVRDVFEIIAFSAAGIWALWTFWYQASYEPAHARPLVEWTITLEREAVRPSDGLLAVRAHAVGSNKGKATDHLVSAVVNLFGAHVRRNADAGLQAPPATAPSWDINPTLGSDEATFLASQGTRWGDRYRAFVHPDQDFPLEFLFWVDPKDYDVLAAQLLVRDEKDENFPGSHYATRLVDGGSEGVRVSSTDECDKPGVHCVTSSYETTAELPLWPRERDGEEHVARASSGDVADGGAR